MDGVLLNRRGGLLRLEMYDLPLMCGKVSIHKHASFNVTAGRQAGRSRHLDVACCPKVKFRADLNLDFLLGT
jgi:hypothetical protein